MFFPIDFNVHKTELFLTQNTVCGFVGAFLHRDRTHLGIGGGFRYPNLVQRAVKYMGIVSLTVQYLVDTQLSIDGYVCFKGGKQVLTGSENNQTSAKLVIQKSNFNRKRFGATQTFNPPLIIS